MSQPDIIPLVIPIRDLGPYTRNQENLTINQNFAFLKGATDDLETAVGQLGDAVPPAIELDAPPVGPQPAGFYFTGDFTANADLPAPLATLMRVNFLPIADSFSGQKQYGSRGDDLPTDPVIIMTRRPVGGGAYAFGITGYFDGSTYDLGDSGSYNNPDLLLPANPWILDEDYFVADEGATVEYREATPGTPAVPGQVVAYPGESAVALPDQTFQRLVNVDGSNVAEYAGAWKETLSLRNFSVKDYGASGSGLTTTGGITAGSSIVSVVDASDFRVGQGLLIKGAGGTIAGHTVGKILSIVGNQITLNVVAISTVVGVTVQHDDSEAINATIAAAAAIGANAFAPSGHYRCNGYFDSITDSILTFPQIAGVSPTALPSGLVGEAMGRLDDNSINVLSGGVVLVFSYVVETETNHYAISAAAYVETPSFGNIYTEWSNREIIIDKVLILASPNPSIGGICLKNTFRAHIGGDVAIIAKSAGPRSGLLEPGFAFPDWATYGTVALYMPAALNSVKLDVGPVSIFGWGVGVVAGEHCHFHRPQIGWCRLGVGFPTAGHVITGVLSVENCVSNLQSIGGNAVLDLTLQCETSDTTTGWWNTTSTINDQMNVLYGQVRVQSYDKTNAFSPEITVLGAAHLRIQNLITGRTSGPGTIGSAAVYANDAAADADATLLGGMPYRLTGSRVIYRKP